MTIKPQKSTVFAWFFILSWIPAVMYLRYIDMLSYSGTLFLIAFFILVLALMFTKAFSTYYLDYDGITQKCFFATRYFAWKDFKFIGKNRDVGGNRPAPALSIRCSTVPLPKNLTAKELEKKSYWPPSRTITIEWPEKGGDEFYREVLSYCGGERDIRE